MSNPVFHANRAALKSKLRLTGSAAQDAEAILDQTIQEVRIGFYDFLGSSRVEKILAMPFSENPTTREGVMRLKAMTTETKWVKMLLLRALPVLFMDASGDSLEAWNDEAMTRQASQSDLAREINRLNTDVQDALKDLRGDQPVDPGVIAVTTIESDRRTPRPGDSIRKFRRGVLN
jgi:hypothetical protein